MIDRDGLFSPNATSRGEPDSDKLAYLSLRINGLAGDVDIRTLEKNIVLCRISLRPDSDKSPRISSM